jgi:hypothetical protein
MNMRKPKISGEIIFVGLLLIGLVCAIFFWPKPAGAFSVDVNIGNSTQSQYELCVNECLMTYSNVDLLAQCQQFCAINPSESVVIVVNGGYFWHGHYYPRAYGPRHDGPHFDPRHDGHDYHGHRER